MKRRDFFARSAGAMLVGIGPMPPRVWATSAQMALSDNGGPKIKFNQQTLTLLDIIVPSEFGLHGKPEPFAREAQKQLAEFLEQSELTIRTRGALTRWGEVPAHVADASGETLQEKMVKAGCARVRPMSASYPLLDRLFTLEQQARFKKRGLWALDAYKICRSDDASSLIGSFGLVEGVVVRVAKPKSRIYINFGLDYREDFTITIASRLGRKWQRPDSIQQRWQENLYADEGLS